MLNVIVPPEIEDIFYLRLEMTRIIPKNQAESQKTIKAGYMPRVVHFEYHCDDVDRAVKFYSSVFGWEITKWDGLEPYWLVKTGEDAQPGINGGFMKRRDPAGTVYNTIDVPSVDEFVSKIENAGGQIVLPKMAIPGVGWLAYFTDTEGNISGIM